MIPLVDTFFLLLAFFISAVITMENVKGLPVQLPSGNSMAPFQRQNRLTVTIGSGGIVQLEGESVSLLLLRERLARFSSQPSVQVGIRADRLTPYEWLVQVLSTIRETGIERVTLLTLLEEGG